MEYSSDRLIKCIEIGKHIARFTEYPLIWHLPDANTVIFNKEEQGPMVEGLYFETYKDFLERWDELFENEIKNCKIICLVFPYNEFEEIGDLHKFSLKIYDQLRPGSKLFRGVYLYGYSANYGTVNQVCWLAS